MASAKLPGARLRVVREDLSCYRGIEIVGLFVECSSQLFVGDKTYHWNLWAALRSSHILAADYVLRTRHDEALLMVFFAAFLEECLARGFYAAKERLTAKEHSSVVKNAQGALFQQEFMPLEVFLSSAYFNRAAKRTKSSSGMATFLGERLERFSEDAHWVHRLGFLKDEPVAVLHDFDTSSADPEALLTVNIRGCIHLEVYPDASLRFRFNLCYSLIHESYFKLLDGRSRVKSRRLPCPCIKIAGSNTVFYLITSGDRTLRELGIQDGADVRPGNAVARFPGPEQSDGGEVKPKSRRAGNRCGKRPKGKRKPVQAPSSEQNLSLDALRELHSNAMEAVLNELRPRLKMIKQQIDALSLHKERPKERKTHERGKGKENAPNAKSPILAEEAIGSKAGKAFYPILVGEATDLFKMAQLRSRKALRRGTLDLHGCSRYKALGILRKSLEEWIDEAMKGEYPFVIAVDIICGGGCQVLSEVVAQFIRNTPQVANRPKSIA